MFDRLDDKNKKLLAKDALSLVSFDNEKDKINVGAPQIVITVGGRMKYGEELINAAEIAVTMIQEIEEEKKAQREAEKATKKAKKNGSLARALEVKIPDEFWDTIRAAIR